MEAKDTVIKTHNPQILPEINQYQIALLHQQAEISFKAGQEQARWDVGEELCCLIGNKMLLDIEVGKLLGKQLEEYMKHYLKDWFDPTTSDNERVGTVGVTKWRVI